MNAMDKRLKEHIDKLLRLYDEARTTDEQERELADFFSQPHDTLPEEWERYAALFTAFAGSESLFSEAELEAMSAPRTSRRFWPWLMGAAATVALLVGFFLYHPQTTGAPDYLAVAEQPTPSMEEMNLTSPDSAFQELVSKLEIVPYYPAHLGDSNNVMRLGGDCPPPAESVPAHSDSNKIERMDGIKDVMVAKAEPKTEPAPTISPSDEVRIGQTQMKKTAPQLTFNTPTLDVDKVFTPKDSTSQSLVPKLDIVFNSSELGNTNIAMRLRGGSNADPDSLLTLLCVSVNGELFLDSLNFLAMLHEDEIRDYFLSQGKVFDDIDIWLTKEDSTIISKYGWLPKSKGKHMLMEITLKKEGYLAESEIFPDFDKASQENSMEFCGLGESPQVEIMTLAEESPDDWVIVEQPIQNTEELGITTVDSALMGRIAGLDIVPAHSDSSEVVHIEEIKDVAVAEAEPKTEHVPTVVFSNGLAPLKVESELELRIERDKYLTFVDRMLYGRKAGCVGNGNRNRIPTGYKSGDTLQTIPTNFIQAGMTNKGAIDWGYLPLSFGRRDANQIWTHRRSGYDWTMTPYHKYQETLLKKLGISISFPESAVRYFSHNGVMEDWAIFTAGMSDASNTAAIFDGRMFVQISPDFCVVLENIERDTGKHVFRNRIDMVRERKLSVDTYNSTSFEGLIRSNCDVPWIGWFDYSGEDLRKLEEWNGADYITRFKESAWVKNSHAEIGFIVRFPNFKKILYNFNALGDTNVGSSYNACYGIELFRLYNPRSINMLFFINTEKEKDILKCVEEVCRYVSFDNSHIGHETKRKEKIKVPDSLSVK